MLDARMRSLHRAKIAATVAVLALLPEWGAAGDVPVICCSATFATSRPSAEEQLLRQHGVMPDAPGLRRYLAAIEPCPDRLALVRDLVEQLGAPGHGARTVATRALFMELSRQPHLTRGELAQALAQEDEEVRHRAAGLLLRVDEVADEVLLAAMRVIEQRQIKGLAEEILAAMPYCDNEYLRDAARSALLTTVGYRDASLLRAMIAEREAVEVRLVAIAALERAIGPESQADLVPLLGDSQESVRLAAAAAAANYQPRTAVSVAAPLLESDDEAIRAGAAALLREMTGRHFGYTAFDAAPQRAAATANWNQWIADHADTAVWQLPLGPIHVHQQRVVVCTFNPFRVKEVALHGENLFDSNVADSACGAVRLPNGRRVLADWGSKSLIFLDAHGRREYAVDLPGTPNGLDLLDNGNLLVPLFHEKSLVEITPAGETVWHVELEGRPTDARRLPGGGTLVALNSNDRIIEINRRGDVVWSIDDCRSPESARRLKNGNTLVAMRLGVKEYDPSGAEVWSLEELSSPYDAVLLDNGNILVGHAGGLREVDRRGQMVREFPVGTVRRIFYY